MLWERGPSTVREVYEHRFQAQGVAQNTVQSMLHLMTEKKKLVSTASEGRTFIYTATFSRDDSTVRYLDIVFDGAASEMVMSLLRSERISPAELEHLRTLIDEARGRNGRRETARRSVISPARLFVPAGAAQAFSPRSSDFFRRSTMLVKNPLQAKAYGPRRWLLLAALLVAGVGFQAVAAPVPEKKQDKKEEKKAAEKKETQPLPGFPDVKGLFQQLPPGLDEARRKLMADHLKRVRQMMQQMQQQFPGGNLPPLPGFPGFPGGIGGGLPQLPPLQLPRLRGRLGGMRGFNPFGPQQQQPRLGARVEKPRRGPRRSTRSAQGARTGSRRRPQRLGSGQGRSEGE